MSRVAKHVVIVHCHQGQLSDKLTNRNLNIKKLNIYIDRYSAVCNTYMCEISRAAKYVVIGATYDPITQPLEC